MKRVKVLDPNAFGGGAYSEGDVIELQDTEADTYVQAGWAEETDEDVTGAGMVNPPFPEETAVPEDEVTDTE